MRWWPILVLLVAVAVLFSSRAQAADRTLQMLEVGKAVVPQRIGQLAADGSVVQWLEYAGRQDCDLVLVWDAFDPDEDGQPCCGEGCGLAGPGYRWFFGRTYCNPYVTNDMEFEPGADFAERLELAWFWYCDGSGTENMAIILELYTDFDDTCILGDEGLGERLGGVILDFGPTECNPDPFEYYWTDVDLCDLDWLPLDADGAMAYSIRFATYDDTNPDVLCPATCAQPMLWGTNNPLSHGPGTQGPIQWDDDFPPDWKHSVPDECYDLDCGTCPCPMCAMACFYDAVGELCVGDLDGDGVTGQSDLGILLADWGCSHGCVGDLDGDDDTDQADLGVLLGDWGCGR